MILRILLIAVLLIPTAIVVGSHIFQGEKQTYDILGNKYCVPKNNLVDPSPFWWIYQIEGLDESRPSIMYHFEGDELAQKIKDYSPWNGEVSQSVSGLVSYLTPLEIERARKEHPWGSLWSGTKAHQERSFEKHQLSGLYIVYEFSNKETWYLFKVPPSDILPPPKNRNEFVVGGCQNIGRVMRSNGKPIHDHQQTLCNGSFMLGQVDVSYSFSMDNVHLLPEIEKFLMTKLAEWKQCD